MSNSSTIKCAIYTRKSSEEGLDQEFNSLDAQREACEAFIKSQKHEGWVTLSDLYDDGGLSGGTLERPALKQLLKDIDAGGVDAVVVYKVDRLTRSLADFVKIVETFDAKSVPFVSVTQQFNTTTSMGRLTLNMLLSFAQFEREVTGERIRDKVAASKKKGMWMGGLPPLGFDAKDGKLIVNETEAESVRHIYRRYVQLGSVRMLKQELDRDGIVSKVRVNRYGKRTGGKPLARGALYLMLSNPIYRGMTVHKDICYPGQHDAILDEELWDKAQSMLVSNRTQHKAGTNCGEPSMLVGLLYDDAGECMTPSHAGKNGRRYRYYISRSIIRGSKQDSQAGRRIPAGEIEGLVEDRLKRLLLDGAELHAVLEDQVTDPLERQHLISKAVDIASAWIGYTSSQKRQLLTSLIARIDIMAETITVQIRVSVLASILVGNGKLCRQEKHNVTDNKMFPLTIAARLKRVGIEQKLLIESVDGTRQKPNPHLLQLITKAHELKTIFIRGGGSISEMAKEVGLSPSYFTRLLRVGFLSPDITKAILAGRQPPELTSRQLMMDTRLPILWEDQRKDRGLV